MTNVARSEGARPRFSVLDLAPVREDGSIAEAFRNTVELAQHAEQWGFTRFWLAEHHNIAGIASAATAVLIGHVAGQTSSLRVGAGGIMLQNHSALVIAEQFGTLATLYPGRIDLGVGRAPGGDTAAARALRRHFTPEDFPKQFGELREFLGFGGARGQVRAIPGEGTKVPVWLLGSSTFSAHLAAELGLPFAFASHFAPELLEEALYLYRQNFRPSDVLERPYMMIGVPVIAGETDREAERLATTPYQRFLALIRGGEIYTVPPVESMDGLWNEQERALVDRRLGLAVIGGPDTVRRKLDALIANTGVDELIFTSDLYRQKDRLRSYEIVAEAMKSLISAREWETPGLRAGQQSHPSLAGSGSSPIPAPLHK